MKHLLLSIVCALALVGCVATPTLSTEALDFEPLVESHNAAVSSDVALESAAKDAALAQAQALLDLVAGAPSVTQGELQPVLRPVVDRYDAYLFAAWPQLTPFEQRYLTRTSDLARLLGGLPVTVWPSR